MQALTHDCADGAQVFWQLEAEPGWFQLLVPKKYRRDFVYSRRP